MIHTFLHKLLLIYVGLSRPNTRFLKITEITPWIFRHRCRDKVRNLFRTALVRPRPAQHHTWAWFRGTIRSFKKSFGCTKTISIHFFAKAQSHDVVKIDHLQIGENAPTMVAPPDTRTVGMCSSAGVVHRAVPSSLFGLGYVENTMLHKYTA